MLWLWSGYLLSVALALGFPQPSVRWNPLLSQPGLSSEIQQSPAMPEMIISYLPHLDTILFTMPISFLGRVIQYLGRIGRDGQQCLAIDFVDENIPMLKSSFNKRLKGYKQMGYSKIGVKKESSLFDF